MMTTTDVTIARETRPTLLVIDDEPGVIALVTRFVGERGFDVVAHRGGRSVLEDVSRFKADVALVDLQMPEITGLDLLRAIRRSDPTCGVILMTAHPSVDSAIEAVKLGALDYLQKPFDFDRLAELLVTVRAGIDRRERLLAADSAVARQFECCGMIGRSPVMQELFDALRRLAPHARTALVTGETGTGKELVAGALHRLGPRRHAQFVTCNCSAIVESLAESELFGHVRGACTGATTEHEAGLFEQADGGTLLLDEIGELSLPLQAKLLRAIEYGEVRRAGSTEARHVDVVVVAATHRNLAADVAAGRFRQDLFYRLNVVPIRVPSLRERREDIPYLTAAFLKEFAARFGKSIVGLSAAAEQRLHHADWPGNVRQLRNTIERACMLCEGRMLSDHDLSALADGAISIRARGRLPSIVVPGGRTMLAPLPRPTPIVVDRETCERVLSEVGGNRSAAARRLGLSRRALYRRLDTFGLR
jgi:DNA-binding NtrC family response regulator